eukprot:3937224-Rhodomonas_salina.3
MLITVVASAVRGWPRSRQWFPGTETSVDDGLQRGGGRREEGATSQYDSGLRSEAVGLDPLAPVQARRADGSNERGDRLRVAFAASKTREPRDMIRVQHTP